MFTLTLVTPEKKLLAGQEIEEVFVPAHRGELNILPGHAPIVTTLTAGVLKYRLKGESRFHHAAISWGYCQVNPFGVNVLAETAERPDELDAKRIDEALKNAETKILSGEVPVEDLPKLQNKVARALARRQTLAESSGQVH